MRCFWLRTLPLLLIAICASVGTAQNTCTKKLAELPAGSALMGFQLGMTTEQVKIRVPQVVFPRNNDLGVSRTSINPDFDPKIDKASFRGVRTVSLDFLDGRLTSLWIGYDSSFKWHTVGDFVKGINLSLQLPDAWQEWKIRGQQLRCEDFLMTVSIVAEGPSFRIVDLRAEEEVASRREAQNQREDQAAELEQTAEQISADSSTKIYYAAACPPENPIPQKDQVRFKSVQEAETAGYKRSKNCSH